MGFCVKFKKLIMIMAMACISAVFFSGCMGFMKGRPGNAPVNTIKRQVAAGSGPWDTEKLKPNYLALARDLMAKGFYDVAKVQLDQALAQQKNNPEIYDLKGVCARETGDFGRALQYFKKALDIDSKNAAARNNLGILYTMQKKWKKAEKNFTLARNLDPARADFFNNAGVLFMKEKHFKKASQNFVKAIELQPGFETASNNLAITLGYMNEFDHAFEILKTVHPYRTACFNMGCIYEMCGKKIMADRMFTLAGSDGSASPFETQIINRHSPVNTAPPTGMPGDIADGIYKRYQYRIKEGSSAPSRR